MKALSIKQPWAKLISQGHKKLEIRSWQTKYRGDILICSSAKPIDGLKPINKFGPDGQFCECKEDEYWADFYHLGKALFIAELYHIEEFKPEHEHDAMVDYSPGNFAFHLQNIRPITPFEVKGKRNFFNIEI